MSAYKKQIGGNHYSKFKIQPSKFINDNKLLFAEGNPLDKKNYWGIIKK